MSIERNHLGHASESWRGGPMFKRQAHLSGPHELELPKRLENVHPVPTALGAGWASPINH